MYVLPFYYNILYGLLSITIITVIIIIIARKNTQHNKNEMSVEMVLKQAPNQKILKDHSYRKDVTDMLKYVVSNYDGELPHDQVHYVYNFVKRTLENDSRHTPEMKKYFLKVASGQHKNFPVKFFIQKYDREFIKKVHKKAIRDRKAVEDHKQMVRDKIRNYIEQKSKHL
jgi:hypothetical protein